MNEFGKVRYGFTALAMMAVLMVGALGLQGCHHEVDVAVGNPVVISSIADLDPTQNPGAKAQVVLAGSQFVVDLHSHCQGDQFEIQLQKHNAAIDHEAYVYSPTGFALQRAAGETYSPPIPLLRFPMQIGDSWGWKGSLSSGTDQLPATARVNSSVKSEYWLTEPVQAVVVEVDLVIGEGAGIRRQLRLHFAKGHGLFRREFGDSSVREPVPAE